MNTVGDEPSELDERRRKAAYETFRRLAHGPKRPIPRAVEKGKIPRALRRLKQWVVWKYIPKTKDGVTKWTKVPYQPNGCCASHGDPATWSTFEKVIAAYGHGGFDGVGFVTGGDGVSKRFRDPFVMIDLDHVRDPKTNVIEAWAVPIINAAVAERAYIELSPSATGFHIIGVGPQGFTGRKANGTEMYCSLRFFTITGGLLFNPRQRVLGTLEKTLTLAAGQIGIPKPVHQEPRTTAVTVIPPTVGTRPYVAAWTDDDILKLAFAAKNGEKLKRLLDGGISDYGDDASRADLACASLLSFWFWLDPVVIARVMEASALYREKWDTKRGKITYLEHTVRKALVGKIEFYGQPRRVLPPTEYTRYQADAQRVRRV